MTTTEPTTRPLASDFQADHETREANRHRFSGSKHGDECFLCGRGLTFAALMPEKAWRIHLGTDGTLLPEGWEPEGGDWNADRLSQGTFPVGPECAKRIPRPFKFREVE